MQLACQKYEEIVNLIKSASFHQLQAYHEKIYNLAFDKVGPQWGS